MRDLSADILKIAQSDEEVIWYNFLKNMRINIVSVPVMVTGTTRKRVMI